MLLALGAVGDGKGRQVFIAARNKWHGWRFHKVRVHGVMNNSEVFKPKGNKKGDGVVVSEIDAALAAEWRTFKHRSEDEGATLPKSLSGGSVVVTVTAPDGTVLGETRTSVELSDPDAVELQYGCGKGTTNAASNASARPELL